MGVMICLGQGGLRSPSASSYDICLACQFHYLQIPPFSYLDPGHHSALKLLLRQIPVDLDLRGHQMSALHWAAEGGHLDCVRALLEYGSDPNVITDTGHLGGLFMVNGNVTPLMLSCRGGYSQISQLLLESDATVDIIDSEGLTALLYAVKKDSGECIEVLARFGANLNGAYLTSDERGLSPVAQAIRKNKLRALAELLRNGADTNVIIINKDNQPMTVFELALSLIHIDCCRMLIIAGHNIQVINQEIFEESMANICALDEQVFTSFCRQLWSARSLKDICRLRIRKRLGRNVAEGWKELPLPKVLQIYLNLDDLQEFIE